MVRVYRHQFKFSNVVVEEDAHVKVSAGKTNVPKTVEGGKCEIRTSTGNIKIAIDPSLNQQ